jgi:hypothetical protein
MNNKKSKKVKYIRCPACRRENKKYIIQAANLGLGAFGFNQMADVRKFNATYPFRLNAWFDCVVGVIGRKTMFSDKVR